jgi:biopolymer transport protein ExbD
MKLRTKGEADINITAMIDCLMQCIIFFMAIMSAQYVYGVAIKFPSGSAATRSTPPDSTKKEKYVNVYISADQIDTGHVLRMPGILKLNGEEIALVTTPAPALSADPQAWRDVYKAWEPEQMKAYEYLKGKMDDLVNHKGYKKEMLMIQGEMKTYHYRTMKVIDLGKEIGMDGFSLVPPTK